MDKNKKIKDSVNNFLENEEIINNEPSVIKGDKSIVERVNKKIITEDGRQLLF